MEFQNGVAIAVLAHALTGATLLWDKVLLHEQDARSLVNFVFWLGVISAHAIVFLPFGFHLPSAFVIGLALANGAIHLAAIYFYYAALKAGEASETLAVMGGFSPVATALFARWLLKGGLEGHALGFSLMTAGGFAMFFSEKARFRALLPLVVVASVLSGLSNVLQKMVFNQTTFVSGYVLYAAGTVLAALTLLARAKWRAEIFKRREPQEGVTRPKAAYFINRGLAGLGALLIYYAVSLANPALVDAISGVRYAVIFLGALFISHMFPQAMRETFSGPALAVKLTATGLVIAGLLLMR